MCNLLASWHTGWRSSYETRLLISVEVYSENWTSLLVFTNSTRWLGSSKSCCFLKRLTGVSNFNSVEIVLKAFLILICVGYTWRYIISVLRTLYDWCIRLLRFFLSIRAFSILLSSESIKWWANLHNIL